MDAIDALHKSLLCAYRIYPQLLWVLLVKTHLHSCLEECPQVLSLEVKLELPYLQLAGISSLQGQLTAKD